MNNGVYRGEFKYDKATGNGTYTLNNIRKSGYFDNGKFISGEFYKDNLLIFSGAFQNDDIWYGKCYYNGKRYEGHSLHGTPHGNGSLICDKTNTKFYGTFVHGHSVGEGKLVYSSGDIYEGAFDHSFYMPIPCGKGRLITNENSIDGSFKNGKNFQLHKKVSLKRSANSHDAIRTKRPKI